MGSTGLGIYGGGVTSQLRDKLKGVKSVSDLNQLSLIKFIKPTQSSGSGGGGGGAAAKKVTKGKGGGSSDEIISKSSGGAKSISDIAGQYDLSVRPDGVIQGVDKNGNVQLFVPTKYIGAANANSVNLAVNQKAADIYGSGGRFTKGGKFKPYSVDPKEVIRNLHGGKRQEYYLLPVDNPSGFQAAKFGKGETGWTVQTGREMAMHPDAYIGETYVGPGFALNRRAEVERIFQSTSFQRDVSKQTKQAISAWLKENPPMRRTKGQVEQLINKLTFENGGNPTHFLGRVPLRSGDVVRETHLKPQLGYNDIRIVDPHLDVNIFGVNIQKVEDIGNGLYRIKVEGISQPLYTNRTLETNEFKLIRASTNKLFVNTADDITIQEISNLNVKLSREQLTQQTKDKQQRTIFNKETVKVYESMFERNKNFIGEGKPLDVNSAREYQQKYGMSIDDAYQQMLKMHEMSGGFAYDMVMASGGTEAEALLARERVRRATQWSSFKKTGTIKVDGTFRYDVTQKKPELDAVKYAPKSGEGEYAGYQKGIDTNADTPQGRILGMTDGDPYHDMPRDNPLSPEEIGTKTLQSKINDWRASLPEGITPSDSISRVALGIKDEALPLTGKKTNLEKYLERHIKAVAELPPSKTKEIQTTTGGLIKTDASGQVIGLNKSESAFVKRELAKQNKYSPIFKQTTDITVGEKPITEAPIKVQRSGVKGSSSPDEEGNFIQSGPQNFVKEEENFASPSIKISDLKIQELQDQLKTVESIKQRAPDKGLGSRSTAILKGPNGESFLDARQVLDGTGNIEDVLIGDYSKAKGAANEAKISPLRHRDYTVKDVYNLDENGNIITIGQHVKDDALERGSNIQGKITQIETRIKQIKRNKEYNDEYKNALISVLEKEKASLESSYGAWTDTYKKSRLVETETNLAKVNKELSDIQREIADPKVQKALDDKKLLERISPSLYDDAMKARYDNAEKTYYKYHSNLEAETKLKTTKRNLERTIETITGEAIPQEIGTVAESVGEIIVSPKETEDVKHYAQLYNEIAALTSYKDSMGKYIDMTLSNNLYRRIQKLSGELHNLKFEMGITGINDIGINSFASKMTQYINKTDREVKDGLSFAKSQLQRNRTLVAKLREDGAPRGEIVVKEAEIKRLEREITDYKLEKHLRRI